LNKNCIEITAKGLKNGIRHSDDGITFFGLEHKYVKDDLTIDFYLNFNEKEYLSNVKNPIVFFIYFRRDLEKYYIRSIKEHNEKFYIFALIDKFYVFICKQENCA
jgi:hypothetical protein